MLRGSKALTVLAVVAPVAGAVVWAGSASAHPTAGSAAPSTAKLQKEITALKKELPKTYLSSAKAKKTYLSSAAAGATYLKSSTAATNLINGNGYIQQGVANIADVHATDSEPLFTTRDGLELRVRTNPSAADTVQLVVTNNTGVLQYLTTGTSETTLLVPGGPTYDFPLGNGAAGKGDFVFSIASATSPLQIDTLNVGQESAGGADQIWAQLIHSGS